MTDIAPFSYRPQPVEWQPFDRIVPFKDKRQEQEYERWREDMIFRVYGPQNKKTWEPQNILQVSRRHLDG